MATVAIPTKIKVAEPEAFDGSAHKFRDWHRQLLIYIRGRHIIADDDRILLTLSYMKTGTAAAWANRFFDLNAADLGTWEEFAVQLKAAFEDKTLGRKAREKLEHLHQGTSRIDDFISRFEALTVDAGIDDNDLELIRLIEHNVKAEIIDPIYASADVPTTYAHYRTRVLGLGRLLEQRQEQKSQDQRRFLPHPVTTTAKPLPTPPLVSTPDRKTPTGVIFGGRGKPMEVDALRWDNRCFSCGAVGHFRHECPSGDKTHKVNVRAVVMDLSEEERRELLDALNSEVTEEPQGEQGSGDKDFQ
jgi:Ty3 transposon capsid-like protein/Zinc knuckle